MKPKKQFDLFDESKEIQLENINRKILETERVIKKLVKECEGRIEDDTEIIKEVNKLSVLKAKKIALNNNKI